ncbi:YcxB family protein [Actinophytocola sp.]|uniref:YcxB family protein n=1 Tax=Actinophytocola sp. TaxID=1872138 RepID=UPI002D7FF362|nr:YcxB family protein [Actinophytocola sp.]HET9139086.1 YcxB family protein [Actinophytocola sp.]
MELRWDPAPADWVDGLRHASPAYRFAPYFAAAFGLAAVVLVFLGQLYAGLFGMFCAVVIALLPLLGVWVSFRRNPVAGTTMTANVDEQSLRMMTVDGTAYSDVDWAKVSGWLETRRGFVLRTGPDRSSPFYPVPNRAFAQSEQRQQFRELLVRRVGPAEQK